MRQPLEGIRVLELTSQLCGSFCTEILHDLGAEIIKIELIRGGINRRPENADSSYASANRGKKRIALDVEKEDLSSFILRLAKTADVFVEDLGPGKCAGMGLGYEEMKHRRSDIIYLTITGYGHEGIFRDYSAQDAIVQALSGFMSISGEVGGRYTKAGIPLAEMFTGLYGAIGILAGIFGRIRTEDGLYLDLAKLDVMLSAMPDVFAKYLNTGQTTRPKGCRHQLAGYFGPTETKDGTVICMAAQDHQFKALTEILRLEGLEKDRRFDTMDKRCRNVEELEPIICSKTRNMTMDQLMEELLKRKIPAGPVYTLEQILNSEYVHYHQLICEVSDRMKNTFRVIGLPLRFSQFQNTKRDFISLPGEFTDELRRELPTDEKDEPILGGSAKEEKKARPLSGVVLLDLTRFMSGPLGTEILENLGARVIKVERRGERSDFCRSTEPTFGKTSAYYLSINSGKQDIALDLKRTEQRELLLELAARCDVVAENFRPGVTEKLGVAYEDIRKRRPDVIYSTVSGFGYTGPYRTRGCVDTVCQAMSGFMSLMGEEGEVIRAGSSIADVCAALYEAAAILASLVWHERTGEGGMVDTPMLSSMISILNGMAAEYLTDGTIFHKAGNRDRYGALFESIPASDGEVMVEAKTQEHFAAFARLLDLPELLEDFRYRTPESRLEHINELEEAVFPETRRMTMAELAEKCRNAGIPAGEVNTVERIARSGYLQQRGLIKQVWDSKEGRFQVLGSPIRSPGWKIPWEKMAAQPGEHTGEVLKEMLGMDETAIRKILMVSPDK